MLSKLIGLEQSGFLAGQSTFDNILAVQEIIHSMETNRSIPPRMLNKVDIEKAFVTVEWNSILATLRRMSFPEIWITWNINHLMFTDDLILITMASRKSVRISLFCLNMYANITGQKPNLLKWGW